MIDIAGLPKLDTSPIDPAEGVVRGMQIKSMQQQQQGASLDLQQKQRDMQDQATMRQAYMDSNGDLDQTLQRAMKSGASPKALMGLRSSMLEMQQKMANLSETQLKVQQGHGAAISSEASGLLSEADPAKRAAAFPGSVQRLVSGGYMTAQDGQKMLAGAESDPTALSDDNLKMLVAHGVTAKDQADLALKGRTVAAEKETADARALTAKTGADKWAKESVGIEAEARAKFRQNVAGQLTAAQTPAAYDKILDDNQAPHGLFPASAAAFDPTGKPIVSVMKSVQQLGMTPDQQAVTKSQADTLQETKDRDAATARNQAGHLQVAQREQAIRDATFKATLGAGMDATGQPVMGADGKPAANPVAHAIANYQMAPPSPRSMASPVGQMLMRQVLTENKDYDGTKYPERSKITQDFSASGASGKAITSADTALAHLNTLSQAGQAIKNGDVQLINRLANAVGAHVGQSPQVTYEAILQTVSPEISKAVIGAAGGEADREKMAAGFSSKLSDQQREGAIGATAQLLGARVHKMGQAYESDMGKPLARQLSPESQQVLQRYSGGTGAGGNTGGAAVIPAPVQKALSSASPGIHTLTDGSKWMKASDGTVTAAK